MQEYAVTFKQSLSTDSVLAHYHLQLPLYLAGDTSCYGIGAVLSHRYPQATNN